MSALSAPHFADADAAREFIEAIRWPNGPVCPHCAEAERRYATKREGRYRCAARTCRKDFSVTTGTAMEASHVPLHKWLVGFYLMASSKKGVSAHQLHRTLEITYKSAWFLAHRIREAMRAGGLTAPMGEGGGVVEADETYIGRKKGIMPKGGGFGHKMKVMSLVERGRAVRSIVLDKVSRPAVEAVIRENVSHEARLMTDTARYYARGGFGTAEHGMVNHYMGEYARGDVHVNTLEGYFSIFKRGMKGIYQHCAEKHLHRYLAEFDFRYNNRAALGVTDKERAAAALRGAEGKRLMYR